jgi:FkbM family methyltransferase
MNKYVRIALALPILVVKQTYVYVFGRSSMQSLNNFVLSLAMRARGYNNFRNARRTGEYGFMKLLARYDPKLCIDIGANKGGYAEDLLSLTRSKVISFEPLPKAFEILSRLKGRFEGRFECINKGVGDKIASLELHYGAEDSPHASFSSDVRQIEYVGRSNVHVMRVDVITLDSFLESHFPNDVPKIDLIKIDTEGFECEVLAGARKTIAESRPKFVQIEFNLHQLFREQSLFTLASLLPGYRVYQLLPYGQGMVLRDPKEPESNIYHFSNFVFVRDDIVW